VRWGESGLSRPQALRQTHGDPVSHSRVLVEPVGQGEQILLEDHRIASGAVARRGRGLPGRGPRSAGAAALHARGQQLHLRERKACRGGIGGPALAQLNFTGFHRCGELGVADGVGGGGGRGQPQGGQKAQRTCRLRENPSWQRGLDHGLA
jgi:hypothetical protein